MPRFTGIVTSIMAAAVLSPLIYASQPRTLTVIMQFERPYSAASVEEMEVEFERIVRPAGMQLEWRMAENLNFRDTFDHVVIARFKGNCDAERSRAAGSSSPRLGLTHVISGDLSPFAELDCGQIRGLMAQNPATETTIQSTRLLGQAMARVLAHEVYHALLKTAVHGPRGIAKASLGCADLFSGTLRFEPDQIARIGRALSRSLFPVSAIGALVLP